MILDIQLVAGCPFLCLRHIENKKSWDILMLYLNLYTNVRSHQMPHKKHIFTLLPQLLLPFLFLESHENFILINEQGTLYEHTVRGKECILLILAHAGQFFLKEPLIK